MDRLFLIAFFFVAWPCFIVWGLTQVLRGKTVAQNLSVIENDGTITFVVMWIVQFVCFVRWVALWCYLVPFAVEAFNNAPN